jgi:CRISPR-associated endonuclease Cas2
MSKPYNPAKEKILALLSAGIVLSFDRSPLGHIRTWKNLSKEWEKINKIQLKESIRYFYKRKLIDFYEHKDGTVTIIATEEGKKRDMRNKVGHFEIGIPKDWDKKWRIVIFDIPEDKKIARDTLRRKIKKVGFLELQKSVWVYPYECANLINFMIEFYKIKDFVKYIVAEKINNDEKIKRLFNLQ